MHSVKAREEEETNQEKELVPVVHFAFMRIERMVFTQIRKEKDHAKDCGVMQESVDGRERPSIEWPSSWIHGRFESSGVADEPSASAQGDGGKGNCSE